MIVTEEFEEGFLVLDLANNNNKSMLKLYELDKNENVIKYYIDNFIEISQIKHKNLLESYSFNLVESINLKKNNIPLYYTLAEYLERPVYRSLELSFNLDDTMKVILELMGVIDFLHFRGFIYQYLNPITTFYTYDKSVKIVDLSTISEYKINSYYDESIEGFTAPETFIDINNADFKADYYSLGMMMKYLLFEDYLADLKDYKFKQTLNLNSEQTIFLTRIINNLTNKLPSLRDISLREHIDNIIDFFDLNYTYDLAKERSAFYSKTKIVGRDKELHKLLPIDFKYNKAESNYDLAIISGDDGGGKTKLLNELSYQLKIRGVETYYMDIKENNINKASNIVTLIKDTLKNTSNEILSKYSDDLSLLIPELDGARDNNNLGFEVEKYKVFNRIANYFKDISKTNKVYLIIDNFHKIKDDFISVLDYIVSNIDNNEISIVIGLDRKFAFENSVILETIDKWKLDNKVIDLKLDKLNEEDIGKLTKSILGISYIPKKFSSILYKGSQGNPLYLEYIIKYLFNKEELYINSRGNWSLKTYDYSTLPIPSNINKAIEEQLNKINLFDLEVLQAISIFTDKFTKGILSNILEIDSEYLELTLRKLISERFIEKYDDFIYGIITNGWQRIMYSRIRDEKKQDLHKKAAHMLIKENEGNSYFLIAEIIYHLVKAGDKDKALEIIFKEWDKLENKYSDQSIYLCEEAYKLINDNKDKNKLIILDRLVDIHSVKGNIDNTDKYLKELIELSNLQSNIKYQIKSLIYKSSEYLKVNLIEKAYDTAVDIENMSRDNDIIEGIINAQIIKCRILLDSKGLDFLENLLNEAKDLSYKSNNNEYLGAIYNLLGFGNHIEGNTEIAISYYKQSIEHSINSNNMLEATKPMNNLAEIYSVNHGNIDMALYYYTRGLEIANLYGFTQSSIIFLNNLGELYKNSADMHKALELFEESRNGAIKIGDYKMIFLANANLGSLYLNYNMMDKAYECYKFLESEYRTNPINEIEILNQYNMFLGEYYEAFGDFSLSVDHFQRVIDSCKGYNIRDYLRAKIKIIYINYMQNEKIDYIEVNSLILELTEAKQFYDKQKFIIYLSILLHLRMDSQFANELLELYDNMSNSVSDPILNDLRKCIDFLIEDTEFGLEKIEKTIEYSQDLKLSNIILYIYIILGKKYFSKENYIKSTRYFLKSLDLIYIAGDDIPNSSLYEKYIKTREVKTIKKSIIKGLQTMLNSKVEYKLDTLNDLSKLMGFLPDDDFNSLFHNNEQIKTMYSLEGIISNLTQDNNKNIDIILNYLSFITLADKAYILKYDDKTNTYRAISSLENDDTNLPSESILIQSNKNTMGLLMNKNIEELYNSRYSHYFKNDTIAIICIPINIPLKTKEVSKDRRKRMYSANQNNKGFIYLQAKSSLNRFDLKRLRLINSLSYLIYLNMENNDLKLISSVDKLTNIYTRKYFEQKLVEILNNLSKTNKSFTIMMLDIDDFKSVNDTYGHIKGDEVLALVAATIKNSIRHTDLVGRYGGEEFIILLSDSTISLGKNIAEKIRVNIENMKIPGISRNITVSIGLSQYPNHSQLKDELINKADQALYYSKNFLKKNSSAIWNVDMGSSYNRIDKLAGVLTGNTNIDNRNLLTILDMIELGIQQVSFKEKTHLFLGRTLDTVDGEYATLFLVDDNQHPIPYRSRVRLNTQWVKTPPINMEKIKSVIVNRMGEFLIDWDDIENVSPLTGVPNWQSIMIIPLIKEDVLKGILYISVPLDEKEFDFNAFNLTKFLSNIFASNL